MKQNNILSTNLSFNRISLNDKAMFANNLAIMLKSGLTLIEAFDILIDQAKGAYKQALKIIVARLMAGNNLAEALAQFPRIFSPFFISSTAAGEASGTLEENLANMADHLSKEKELKEKIKSAMFYPMIVLALGATIAMVIVFFVLPKITPVFMGLKVELPLATRILIWLAGFTENYGGYLFGFLIFLAIFFIWLLRQRFIKPLTHFLILNTPIIKSLSRSRNLAVFSRTLGTMLKSGLSIDEALHITAGTVHNYYYQASLEKIRERVSKGNKLADSLKGYLKYFPKMAIGLLGVGEKSGNLEEELFNIAGIYEQRVDTAAKRLTTALEPLLLIVVGFVVGWLALAIITPIYQITGNIYR